MCVVNACRQMTEQSAFGDSLPAVLNQRLKPLAHNDCAQAQTITWHILPLSRQTGSSLSSWYLMLFFDFLSNTQDWHSTCFISIRPSAFEKWRNCTIEGLWMHSQWFADPSSIIFVSKSVCLRRSCSRKIFEQHGLLKRARSQANCCCDHAKPPVFQLRVFWRGANR